MIIDVERFVRWIPVAHKSVQCNLIVRENFYSCNIKGRIRLTKYMQGYFLTWKQIFVSSALSLLANNARCTVSEKQSFIQQQPVTNAGSVFQSALNDYRALNQNLLRLNFPIW